MMNFFEDIPGTRPIIDSAIKRFGYAAEHNSFWYEYYLDPGYRNIFVESDKGYLFTAYNDKKKKIYVSFDPLAEPRNRAELIVDYIEWVFKNMDVKKVWFQIETPIRRELLKLLPDQYRSNRLYFTLTWPIYDLREFDPSLPGGHYKTIRKEMNGFYKNHSVSVEDAKRYQDTDNLHLIVKNWKERRPKQEYTAEMPYHHLVDGRFQGMDEARIFVVDGKPVGFNAGWMVPNSNRFYGAVGVHDYSIDNLGTALYLEDLVYLKKHGYGEVDMAGSEKSLLQFKNKFCNPKWTYQTSHFSVVRKNEDAPQKIHRRPQQSVVLQ